jgi:hypothetical protein
MKKILVEAEEEKTHLVVFWHKSREVGNNKKPRCQARTIQNF